jgi:hypothetical protein
VTESGSAGPKAPAGAGGCVGGCLVMIAGLAVGLAVEIFAADVIASSWSYCFNVPGPMAQDMADSPRFYLFEGIGYLALYWLCVPLGFLIARRIFAARGRLFRIVAGILSAVLLVSVVFAGDLMLNISARGGMYLTSRCPAGRPPWWPGWIPARDSPNPCGTGPCLGAGA